MIDVERIRALTFDVFGTCTDWRSSIIREARSLGAKKGIDRDWALFADSWRQGYRPAMNRVRLGELPWTNIDRLHRMILDELLEQFDIQGLSEAEKDDLNRAWHRLSPWPDTVPGLTRLKKRFIIATLSNGNIALLTNMAKNAGMPWDCILSAELVKRYKRDREVYEMAISLLGLEADQVMMVAAHKDDLKAAKSAGMRTALVPRPKEYGPGVAVDTEIEEYIDVKAEDFLDLAVHLGA